MKQYLDLCRKVLETGELRTTRTGVRALSIFDPDPLRFDLQEAFPIISTKKMPFKAIVTELVGFLRGYTSAAQFRELGCNIWNANANDLGLPESPNAWLTNPNRKGEDDLGRIYGAQWRDWRPLNSGPNDAGIDQIRNLIEGLKNDPFGRRHLVSAWNPGELDRMALPPCHYAFQCYVREHGKHQGFLDMKAHMRSVDVFLGLPFNITSYATLLEILADIVGLRAGRLSMDLGDTHIYENHLAAVLQQIRRTPKAGLIIGAKPTLRFAKDLGADHDLRVSSRYVPVSFKTIDEVHPDLVHLIGYTHHDAIKAPMAV